MNGAVVAAAEVLRKLRREERRVVRVFDFIILVRVTINVLNPVILNAGNATR